MIRMSVPDRTMPSGAWAMISLSRLLRRASWLSVRWLSTSRDSESLCDRTWLATSKSPMLPARTVSNRSSTWSVETSLIAVTAAATTAPHGSAICQSSIGPSALTFSVSVAGQIGASAIIR